MEPIVPGVVVVPPYVAGPLRLEPFRALRLSPSRIGDPATGRAFARPYRAVAARLMQWEERGVIVHDAEPALYLHEYTAAGITIRGLVGALDISRRATCPAERAVLPHEGIHPVQADELADRMDDMQLNPAPILLVQRAPLPVKQALREVRRAPADQAFSDRRQQQHRLWTITDPGVLDTLRGSLAGTAALIADGHHRYAAYLRLQRRSPAGAADHGLAMLIDQDDTPMFLGAIHRVLTGARLIDLDAAADAAGAARRSVAAEAAVAALGPGVIIATDGQEWRVVDIDVQSHPTAVEVLHHDLIPALPRGPSDVTYHHAIDQAMAQVTRRGGIAVLLPAPSVDAVLETVAGDRLPPEKATSFQPKPSLGVLMRSLRDGLTRPPATSISTLDATPAAPR